MASLPRSSRLWKKPRPEFRTCLIQTGAKSSLDFIFGLSSERERREIEESAIANFALSQEIFFGVEPALHENIYKTSIAKRGLQRDFFSALTPSESTKCIRTMVVLMGMGTTAMTMPMARK